ncbi:hypothetical protein [Bradyrhizobium sp. 187]|uniref:hypothetical protein n=1 Tax=Bradyrhizobium sp. 187 TaxID=2782655 RepID=UPI001FFF4986|nr:hypothetical protein [Bradyrhizobium sp. 187]
MVVTTLALHATNSAARIEQMPASGFIFVAANSFFLVAIVNRFEAAASACLTRFRSSMS